MHSGICIYFSMSRKERDMPRVQTVLVMDYRLISHYARVCDASLPWLLLSANELNLTGRMCERRTQELWAVNRFYSMTHNETMKKKIVMPPYVFSDLKL